MSYTVWAVEHVMSPSEHYITKMFSSEELARCFLEGEIDTYEVFTEEDG